MKTKQYYFLPQGGVIHLMNYVNAHRLSTILSIFSCVLPWCTDKWVDPWVIDDSKSLDFDTMFLEAGHYIVDNIDGAYIANQPPQLNFLNSARVLSHWNIQVSESSDKSNAVIQNAQTVYGHKFTRVIDKTTKSIITPWIHNDSEPIFLDSNISLDDIKYDGHYLVTSDSIASTISGLPYSVQYHPIQVYAFNLEVKSAANRGGDGYRVQRLTTRLGDSYIRYIRDVVGTWQKALQRSDSGFNTTLDIGAYYFHLVPDGNNYFSRLAVASYFHLSCHV